MTSNHPPQTHSIPTRPLPEQQNTTPESSVSPTSPRLPNYFHPSMNQPKQLREHRRPLYVPAVLRPTEFPPPHGPMTPPKSLHGSLDSLESHGEASKNAGTGTQFDPTSWAPGLNWMDDEDLGEVTGPPGKEHWKPDEISPTCDSPRCRSSFNLIIRRHHCRHCGHVFCAQHSAYTAPLNQDAKFHADGVLSRICDSCHVQYERWESARSIRHQRRESDDGEHTPTDGTGSPGRRIEIGRKAGLGAPDQQAANSVPKDWAWSTF